MCGVAIRRIRSKTIGGSRSTGSYSTPPEISSARTHSARPTAAATPLLAGRVGGSVEDEVYTHLQFRWSYDHPRRDAVLAVAHDYGLDPDRVAQFLVIGGG
jgi:hypothetical protein